jgi:formylglycine-generating enzyme required for sulfatase activity
MRTRTTVPFVAVLFAASALASVCHAQTDVVLTLKMSTNGLTNWQTIQTVVTNTPASSQAFYRMEIAISNVAPPPFLTTNMALIPAGSFLMGNALSASGEGRSNELPVHTVNVSAFHMDKYEVTKALWDEVAIWAATNGYDINAASASGKAANHPAYEVTWHEAVKWCNARSQKEGLTPCYTVGGVVMKTGSSDPDCDFKASGYRLPTEAEWEKAARGGLSGKRFPWGDTITHSQANYYSDSSYSYDVSPTRGDHPTYNDGVLPYTSPVGSFAANGYGLCDMAGNLWEWCNDWYLSDYYTSSPDTDPRGPLSQPPGGSANLGSRVKRGGAWSSNWGRADYTRAAWRSDHSPGVGNMYLGFRCARSLVP